MRFPERKPSANFCFVIDISWIAALQPHRYGTRSHQIFQREGSSTPARPGPAKGFIELAESERVDVQKKIAAAGRCFCRTLSHALEVLSTGDPEIVRALCNGEIKIDRAGDGAKNIAVSSGRI